MTPTILIVGASSGIGRETALKFSENNWNVLALSRNIGLLKELSKLSLKKKFKKIEPIKLDITNEKQLGPNLKKILKKFSIPDIVFLNAGTNNPNSRKIVSYKETKELYSVNFFGIIQCIEILLPYLKKKKHTQLVLMSSVAGYRGLPHAAAYCSSKAAIISYAEAIYNQCKEIGINVRIICPGFVKTPLTDKNNFKMPMIISAEKAGTIIFNKLTKSNEFEIVFPKLFCFFMKILRNLPNPLFLRLTKKLLKSL